MADKSRPIHLYLPDTPETQELIYRLKVVAALEQKRLWQVVQEKLRQALETGPVPARTETDEERPSPEMSFADLLAPVHREVQESGLTEEDVYLLMQETLDTIRRERPTRTES